MRTHFTPFPTLHTQRLILRQPMAADAEHNFRLRTNEQCMAYIGRPRPRTVSDGAAMLEQLEQDRAAGTRVGWIIALRTDPAMIGSIGLYKLQPEHHLAEVGFQLLPDHWGKGLWPRIRIVYEADPGDEVDDEELRWKRELGRRTELDDRRTDSTWPVEGPY